MIPSESHTKDKDEMITKVTGHRQTVVVRRKIAILTRGLDGSEYFPKVLPHYLHPYRSNNLVVSYDTH